MDAVVAYVPSLSGKETGFGEGGYAEGGVGEGYRLGGACRS